MKHLQWPGMHECCVCVCHIFKFRTSFIRQHNNVFIYLKAKNNENVPFLSYNYSRNLLKEHLV